MREFYAHFQPPMGDQPAYLSVKNKKIPITRAEILRAIPISNVPEEEPSFADRVNETLSDAPRL